MRIILGVTQKYIQIIFSNKISSSFGHKRMFLNVQDVKIVSMD